MSQTIEQFVGPAPAHVPGKAAAAAEPVATPTKKDNPLIYLFVGALLGLALIKSEAASWYRIQEMFRFDSFHMYGILGSALAVAVISLQVIRRFNARTIQGEPIKLVPKEPAGKGYAQAIGGTLFGLGWALLGACPGPIYALIGTGLTVMLVALASAMAGAWAYGYLKPRLIH